MPRKQRFKPSRKPKPSPQTEEVMIGQPVSNTSSGTGDLDAREAPTERDERDDRAPDAESDQRSR